MDIKEIASRLGNIKYNNGVITESIDGLPIDGNEPIDEFMKYIDSNYIDFNINDPKFQQAWRVWSQKMASSGNFEMEGDDGNLSIIPTIISSTSNSTNARQFADLLIKNSKIKQYHESKEKSSKLRNMDENVSQILGKPVETYLDESDLQLRYKQIPPIKELGHSWNIIVWKAADELEVYAITKMAGHTVFVGLFSGGAVGNTEYIPVDLDDQKQQDIARQLNIDDPEEVAYIIDSELNPALMSVLDMWAKNQIKDPSKHQEQIDKYYERQAEYPGE